MVFPRSTIAQVDSDSRGALALIVGSASQGIGNGVLSPRLQWLRSLLKVTSGYTLSILTHADLGFAGAGDEPH